MRVYEANLLSIDITAGLTYPPMQTCPPTHESWDVPNLPATFWARPPRYFGHLGHPVVPPITRVTLPLWGRRLKLSYTMRQGPRQLPF